MPERARTDLWEPQGSNPLGPPGPELRILKKVCGNAFTFVTRRSNILVFPVR